MFGYSHLTIQKWCVSGKLNGVKATEICGCPNCGDRFENREGKPCYEITCKRCGAMMEEHGRSIWLVNEQEVREFIADERRHFRNYVIYCPYCGKFFTAENDVCPDCGRRDDRFEPVWTGDG